MGVLRFLGFLLATMLLVVGFVLNPFSPEVKGAQAAVGTLIIAASGGSPEGTGWSYSAGTITLTSSPLTINASDIVGKLASADLIVDAASISIFADIISPTSNNLTLKSNGNITTANGVDIETQGGSITLQSNSASLGVGSIRLGHPVFSSLGILSSNGGNIVLSGGLDPLTGYAMASSDIPGGYSASGVAMYGYKLDASGGNIVLRGSSGTNGTSSTRAVFLRKNSVFGSTLSTSGVGSISVTGDGSQIGHSNAWGVDLEENAVIRTGTGSINIVGKGNNSAGKNGRGIAVVNASFESVSGDISLTDITDGSGSGYTGTYNGGTASFATLGNVTISADEIVNSGTWSFSGPSSVIRSNSGLSFTADLTVGNVTATNSQNLTVGAPGNSSLVTLNSAITTSGHVTLHGSTLAINALLTATNSNVYLYSSTAATQSAAIVSDGLALIGAGTYNLPNASNNVRVLAGGSNGSKLGAVTFVDSTGGLFIGQVSSLTGLYSSGLINISTVGGDLTLTQPVLSSLNTGNSITMYADKPVASGVVGNGNLIVSGNGALTVESGARALLYSGSQIASTGLFSLVGGEANTRASVDAITTLATISPAISTSGIYALYRLAEVIPAPTPTPTPTPTSVSSPSSLASTGFNGQLILGEGVLLLLSGAVIYLFSSRRKRKDTVR